MDYLSIYKTRALIKFYQEKKINVIFNSPYFSSFNETRIFIQNT